MIFDYFYDDEITITQTTESGTMVNGLYQKSDIKSSITIQCDVQPISIEIKEADYGAAIQSDYKVYCELSPVTLQMLDSDNCIVTYGGRDYKIIKITDWQDYQIIYIKAVQ